ncbi:MAG: transcription-repair coupling factor [Clostridium sp.]|nr:transcription-repair coupling factor [Clostridium sp.]
MTEIFSRPLTELAEYAEFREDLEKGRGPLQMNGCSGSQKMHFAASLGGVFPWTLIVAGDAQSAKEMAEDYRCFEKNILIYPARDLLFYSSDIHGNLITRRRIDVTRHLLEDRGGVVITTVDALMEYLLPPEHFLNHTLTIRSGEELDIRETARTLTRLGYEKTAQVDGTGQFSVRGGILDIFPLTEELPFRVELWGDDVDSIRTFDPESQRSVETVEEAAVWPATEMVLEEAEIAAGIKNISKEQKKQVKALRDAMKTEEAWRLETTVGEITDSLESGMAVHGLESFIRYFSPETVSFLDYFPREGLQIILDEPQHLKERAEAVELEFSESMKGRLENGAILPGQVGFLYSAKETMAMLQRSRSIFLMALDQRVPGLTPKKKYSISVRNLNSYRNSFDMLTGDLRKWKKEKYRVILLAGTTARASRLASDLREEYGLSAFCPDDRKKEAAPGEILVTSGGLHRGFEYPMVRFVMIAESDMFGKAERKKKRRAKAFEGKGVRSFSELSVGDYVVHESHGLGIYRGIEKMMTEEGEKDYLRIEYRDDGVLYIPATRLERIQKYASGSAEKVPKLSKLGGTEWKKTKTRVRGEVREIARDLVRLYAKRQRAAGFLYGPDTAWQKEFEEAFPFEETEDQLAAIEDTKRDMESGRIMDRLICGDVGFGKTEIALRAAFKAVQEGKQVAFLVPTTILAQQHYGTFVQRMKDFPVNVGVLSRFRTPSEQKKTIEELRKGTLDVVIGTHRLLSKDVTFRNLGLLVIDEEQRFGVAHKEKIKQMRENVDVLTLTATPIPRTLHMSLSGIRDMSVLEEAPVDRLPIQTYVMEYSDEIVREAIRRELARGGQVYYVYNRVNTISEMAARLKALVPEAEVVYAHGQMRERELENIMMDFVNGDIDVLVSTTIIETGLDIPNANTIIIHDADRMGLSQLYQIRGRVGRTNRTSFAFLMYRRDKILREEAEKRLQAIREFTELGSGIRIAMRDLEIRGAGNVLGARQSGHMEEVGYDLYCKLLNQAVQELRGAEPEDEEFETEVNCDINAFIPSNYIRNEYQKLDIYKRISSFTDPDDRMDMEDELIDRFGEIPKPVENLLLVSDVRATAHRAGVTEVLVNRQEITLKMYRKAKIDPAGIPPFIEKYSNNIRFRPGDPPTFFYQEKREKYMDCIPMLKKARELLEEFISLTKPGQPEGTGGEQ